jgi:outer membrane protein assembly factor BamD
MKSYRLLLAFIITAVLVISCSAVPDEDEFAGISKVEMLKIGKEQLGAKHYNLAAAYFADLNKRYPFDKNSESNRMYGLYSYFMDQNYEMSFAEAEFLLKVYPQSSNADWVLFMQAYSLFSQSRNWVQEKMQADPSRNDINRMFAVYDTLQKIIDNYPGSVYVAAAVDLQNRINAILAEKQLLIAEYYFNKGFYIASSIRAKELVENYPESCFMPGALVLLKQSYSNLGLSSWAEDVAAVIRLSKNS